ncbi:MAG: FAD-dependent oxidoreductase [bacterium]
MKQHDVVVIGAGIGGLSTAALLSARGVSCLVLEKNSFPGGRASWVERDGFVMDYGLHVNRYAGQGRAAEVLRRIGEKPRFIPTGTPLYYDGGKMTPLPRGALKILTTPLLSFSSRVQMLKILVSSLTGRTKTDLAGVSVKRWLGEHGIVQPDLVELVQLLCGAGIICPDLEKASAEELFYFLLHAVKARHATGYLLGGWRALFGSLLRAVAKTGAVEYGAKVEGVAVEDGRAAGVVCEGRFVRGKAVVCSVPLQQAAGILDEAHLPESVREKIKTLEPTCGISYDFCLRTRVTDVDGIVLTLDPCTMGMFTSNVEPAAAPRGRQLGAWFYPIPREDMDDREFLSREKKKLRSLVEEMFPGVRGAVEYERVIEMRMVDGAMPKVGQTSRDRPAVDCAPAPNLFFAGDTVGAEGHGGDVAFSSALLCAPLVEKTLLAEPL